LKLEKQVGLRMYYRSGTGERCCAVGFVFTRQAAALFCVK